MIRSSHIIGVTCDDCQKVWTYGGADLETCIDKAKASGWRFKYADPLGIPTVRHVCPTCIRNAPHA